MNSSSAPAIGYSRTTAMHEPASRDDPVYSKARLDDWLDDALADTFPASDPVASPPSDAELADRHNSPAPDQAPGAAIRGQPAQF